MITIRSSMIFLLLAFVVSLTGCQKGPYKASVDEKGKARGEETVVLLHKKLKGKIALDDSSIFTTDQGKMNVVVVLRSRSKKPLHVQARCVFKENKVPADETQWSNLYFEPYQPITFRASSKITSADSYSVQVRLP